MNEPDEPSFRWRPLSYLLVAFAAVLFAGGVAGRNPVPIIAAFPLLLTPLVAPILGVRRNPRVAVTGQVEGAGGVIDVVFRLTPEAPVSPGDLRVQVPVPPGIDERAPPRASLEGGRLEVRLAWSVPQPTVASVPLPEVRWEDPIGLIERPVEVSGEPLAIERYPPELHRAGIVRLEHTIALPGETRSRAIGATGEFFGIREAVWQDPPRVINWLASARAGRRLANEYSLDRTGDVLILIDARPTALGPSMDTRLLGIARAAAYGLADAFLQEKTRVGLGVYGEFLSFLPLATGRTHRLRIHQMLFETSLAAVAGPAERCGVALRRYYARAMTTIVLSSLADDESMLLVPHLRRRGFHPVVLSPSFLPLAALTSDLSPEDEAVVGRVGRLLRREQIARTWQDAPAIDWTDFWSLGGFVDFLNRPTLRERGV
ncbi:MAG TPA: DUF58 domain-containing protein [Thermoplasmata archaeon]|nr:DUF58 domain-containing protein [Thermoplasmata archaeon]